MTISREETLKETSAVVLLSAGLDSTVNLYWALDEGLPVRKVLTFDYGQRAALREVGRAQQICLLRSLDHQVISLPWLRPLGGSCLLDTSKPLPLGEDINIHDPVASEKSKNLVWVPNRNGVFINIAAAFAEALGATYIIPGFNLEEAQTFPDNSQNYITALNKALAFSTSHGAMVKCYTVDMNKKAIAQKGQELGIPWNLLWPCYQGQEHLCGACESCQRYLEATKKYIG